MGRYIVKRVLSIIPMFFFISFIIYIALDACPGDAVDALIPPSMIGNANFDLDALREAYGLNDPLLVRYFRWVWNMLHGDFGYSIISGTPVASILKNLLPSTMLLSFAALVISTVLGLVFGVSASIHQDTAIDYGATVFGILGVSFPEFFVGICAIQFFAIKLGWLPTGGRTDYGVTGFWNTIKYYLLPACTLGFTLTAELMRYTRGSMLDVLHKDYIKTARSKGLSMRKVYFKHGFRNALIPIVVLLCVRLPFIIGGAVVVETVFRWPGIGQRLVEAIMNKDYSVVMMIVMMMSLIVMLASVLMDIVTALLDPRVQME